MERTRRCCSCGYVFSRDKTSCPYCGSKDFEDEDQESKHYRTAHDAKEFGEALKDDEDTIEIKGGFAKIVWEIKAKGKTAIAATVVIVGIIAAGVVTTVGSGGLTGPATIPASAVAGTVLVPMMGGSVTLSTALVGIAVAGGGAAILNKIFDYNIEKISDDYIIMRKK